MCVADNGGVASTPINTEQLRMFTPLMCVGIQTQQNVSHTYNRLCCFVLFRRCIANYFLNQPYVHIWVTSELTLDQHHLLNKKQLKFLEEYTNRCIFFFQDDRIL